ncbi:Collagen alpha-1(XII) chain [Dirofilaria immitis]
MKPLSYSFCTSYFWKTNTAKNVFSYPKGKKRIGKGTAFINEQILRAISDKKAVLAILFICSLYLVE